MDAVLEYYKIKNRPLVWLVLDKPFLSRLKACQIYQLDF